MSEDDEIDADLDDWEVTSHSSSPLLDGASGAQRQLQDYVYGPWGDPPEIEPTRLPFIVERYVEYLDNRLAANQPFTSALGETPLPHRQYEDDIDRVKERTLDFETAIRVVLYLYATGTSARELARRSEYSWFRDMLGMGNSISHPTPGNAIDKRFGFELQRFIRHFSNEAIRIGHEHDVKQAFLAEHPDVTADGSGEAVDIDEDDLKENAVERACGLFFEHWKAGRSDFEHIRQWFWIAMIDKSLEQGGDRYKMNTDTGTGGDRLRQIFKRFSERDILEAFHASNKAIVEALREEQGDDEALIPEEARLAADITVAPYYGDPAPNDRMAEIVHGQPSSADAPFAIKYSTITTTSEESLPLILGLNQVTAESDWGGETTTRAEIVEQLLGQSRAYVDPVFLFADRGFDSEGVLEIATDRNIELLTPMSKRKFQKYHCKYMAHMGIEVDTPHEIVERVAEEDGWEMPPSVVRELYVPSTSKNARTAVFRTTNPWIEEDRAEEYVQQYSARWAIESEYDVLKTDFWPDIRSHHFPSRLLYFALGCVAQNAWRVADYWYQIERDGYFDPENRAIEAGTFVDLARNCDV